MPLARRRAPTAAGSTQLAVHQLEVDRRAARRLVAADRAKQPRLDLGVAQRLDLFPRQPPLLGPTDVLRDRGTEVWASVNAFPVQGETTR